MLIKIDISGDVAMLYVIYVRTGSENTTINECISKIDPNILLNAYVPVRVEKYRKEKKWLTRNKILFPGYIFVETNDVKELFIQLKYVSRFTRLISIDKEPLPVTEDELELINRLAGDTHVMNVSTGVIVGSKVIVSTGPLIGLEGLITKIDRHKRKAWLETEMFGRKQTIEVGLEITSKTE